MRQKRICEYLELSCKHTKNFLHLPFPTRRQVYEKAGLIIGELVILRRRSRRKWMEDRNPEADEFTFVYNVLQTCRTIHDEVKYIICTENQIFVDNWDVQYGLSYLNHLTPQICSGLTNLYVHLYYAGPPRYWGSPNSLREKFAAPITIQQSLIGLWRTAISHVLDLVEPQTLTLHLICDTKAGEETEAILEPIHDRPAVLADLRIRLHPVKDESLCAIARQATMRAKGLPLVTPPFRFFDLPAELRLRILHFTDLVTPLKEVQWSPQKGFHVTYSREYMMRMDPTNPWWNGAKMFYMDSEELHEHYSHALQFLGCCEANCDQVGSFCCRRQSSYSSRCHCWTPPRSIMLVCRNMYEHAMEVFYSNNRLIVLPDPSADRAEIGPKQSMGRLSASRFITRCMWPEMLSHLRTIELVFPGIVTAPRGFFPDSNCPMSLDWRFALDHFQAHANLAAMTLIVHMRGAFNRCWYIYRDSTIANRIPFNDYLLSFKEPKTTVLELHAPFLAPLQVCRDGGLRRLFVFLEWDWHWSPPRGSARHGMGSGHHDLMNDELVVEMEAWLEKKVMGDDYDSFAVGKRAEVPSQWMLDIL